jgi:hypothetical protein
VVKSLKDTPLPAEEFRKAVKKYTTIYPDNNIVEFETSDLANNKSRVYSRNLFLENKDLD